MCRVLPARRDNAHGAVTSARVGDWNLRQREANLFVNLIETTEIQKGREVEKGPAKNARQRRPSYAYRQRSAGSGWLVEHSQRVARFGPCENQ